MDTNILARLSQITPEERRILEGQTGIDRALYMQGSPDVINSRKLLDSGKLITFRPHTRFVHFPRHTHDYVEMVYMCQGKTTHIVNGTAVELNEGELLLMNQSATHEICRAEQEDVAVNFIILPEFFSVALADMEEETPLRRFLVDCLCCKNPGPGYLLFRVSKVKPIQNLVENLLFALVDSVPYKRKVSALTMSMLFLQLTVHTDMLSAPEQEAVIQALSYAESNYISGSLTEAAELLHYDVAWLSREIKRRTGSTYTQIVQKKRLVQAAFLLRTTHRNVAEISVAVGYENISYFHRIFYQEFGMSPKAYRESTVMQERTLF